MSGREHKEQGQEPGRLLAVDKVLKTVGGRTWDPQEWEEDPRFVAAIEALSRGHKRQALSELHALYQAAPGHLYGREQLLSLALELKDTDLIAAHVEWALAFQAQHRSPERAVETYRAARAEVPDFAWSEKALLTAQRMGEKARDNRAVVDAAKQLLVQHPESKAIPRALLATADAQLREGRPGLARTTLENLLARYPLDPLVSYAERKLVEVRRQLDEIRQRVEEEERERQRLLERRQIIERQLLLTQQRDREQAQLAQQRDLEQAQLAQQRELETQRELERQRLLDEYQELERQELARDQQRKEEALAAQQRAAQARESAREHAEPEPALGQAQQEAQESEPSEALEPAALPARMRVTAEPFIIAEEELIVYPQLTQEPYVIRDDELVVDATALEASNAVASPEPSEGDS